MSRHPAPSRKSPRSLLAWTAPLALLSLGACATGFSSDVTRYQQLPVPQGQTFAVAPLTPELAGLEFQSYADLVARELVQQGYRPAADAASADLLVQVGYDIDTGRERVRSSGFGAGYGFGYSPFYGRRGAFPGYGGFGRSSFAFGFYDPWAFGPGYNDVYSYTVFTTELQMKIDDQRTGRNVFDGRAEALSRTPPAGPRRAEPGRGDVHRLPRPFGRDGADHGRPAHPGSLSRGTCDEGALVGAPFV